MGRTFVIEEADLPELRLLCETPWLPKGNTKPVKTMTTPEMAVFYYDEALRSLALANYWAGRAEAE